MTTSSSSSRKSTRAFRGHLTKRKKSYAKSHPNGRSWPTTGHRIGYVRVSSFDQNPERQLEHVPVAALYRQGFG